MECERGKTHFKETSEAHDVCKHEHISHMQKCKLLTLYLADWYLVLN